MLNFWLAVLGWGAGLLSALYQRYAPIVADVADLEPAWSWPIIFFGLIGTLIASASTINALKRRAVFMATPTAEPNTTLGWPTLFTTFITACLCFVLGYSWANEHINERRNNALSSRWFGQTTPLDIRISSPAQHTTAFGQNRYRYDAQVIHPLQGIPERLRLYERTDATPLRAGLSYRVSVTLYPIHGLSNPHGFNYENYLLDQKIGATGTIRGRIEALADPPPWLTYGQNLLLERVQKNHADTNPNLALPSVVPVLGLGLQAQMDAEQWQILRDGGVIHLFSISGLHVTFLAVILGTLMSAFWKQMAWIFPRALMMVSAQTMGRMVALVMAWAYGLISGFGVPTQRTLIMMSVVIVMQSFSWRLHWREVAALTFFLLTLYSPLSIVSSGFWLSLTGVVVLLCISAPAIEESLSPTTSRIQWIARALWQATRSFFIVQVWLTLCLTPWLIGFFHRWPSASLLSNLIAVPVVSMGLMPLSLLAVIWPHAGLLEFLLHTEQFFFALMRTINASFPVFAVPAPTWSALILAAIGAVWALMPRGVPLRALSVVLFLPLFTGIIRTPFILESSSETASNISSETSSDSVRVDFLDVGAGLSVVVRVANHTLLFDTGTHDEQGGFSATTTAVLPYLQGEGIRTLDAVVLSHNDRDHAGGFNLLRQTLPIQRLMVGEPRPHWPMIWLDHHAQSCHTTSSWMWQGVVFEFLSLPMEALSDNNSSCVLLISLLNNPEQKIMLTGDLEMAGLNHLVRLHGERLKSTVLQLPHHGSDTSAHPAFFMKVAPRYAVLSGGFQQKNYPAPKMRQQLLALSPAPQMFHTWTHGAVSLILSAREPIHVVDHRSQSGAWMGFDERFNTPSFVNDKTNEDQPSD